ncbi:MAG: FecR domain-containing protein [Myxococcota bacterium]
MTEPRHEAFDTWAAEALSRRTEPSPEVSARLTAAVTRQLAAYREVDQLARHVGEPPAAAVGRLHHQLDVRAARRRSGWGWPVVVAPLVLATAAALVWLRPAAAPDPLEHVKLGFDGLGHVEQAGPSPVVVWEDGRVDVEVEPNRGVKLAVKTEEATVTVVGTAFSVSRAAFATEVTVDHGIVAVACADGGEHRLLAGQRVTCLPSEPAALLRRAVALGPTGDAAARARAIDAGLGLAPEGHPLRAELLARRVELLAASDPRAAIGAAEAYLATGSAARRGAMLTFVGTTTFGLDGCGAVEVMRRAVADTPDQPLAVPLASCVDPDEARAVWAGVTDVGPYAELAAAVRASLEKGRSSDSVPRHPAR